ncbi:MAG TPA: DUF1634 domain-containing protein [Gemmatimonadales bacterium]|nr:DUF1634 domain-containing protein [Gemmatimonadales bacterium]
MTDHRQLEGHDPMELLIGNVLRWGVFTAAAVALVGAAVNLASHGLVIADFRRFTGDAATGVPGILRRVAAHDPLGVMELGVALLIATPIVRVGLSLVGFFRERDRTYVIVTALVLALLVYGLAGGKV